MSEINFVLGKVMKNHQLFSNGYGMASELACNGEYDEPFQIQANYRIIKFSQYFY